MRIVDAGNALCGTIPGNMSVYKCHYNNRTCSAVQSAFTKPLNVCSGQLTAPSPLSSRPPGMLS